MDSCLRRSAKSRRSLQAAQLKIFSCRYSGSCSANFASIPCARRPAVGLPLSISGPAPALILAIRIRLQLAEKIPDLALFNLAIDSKLRACDLIKLRVRDIAHGEHVSSRAIVMQQKTRHPVQFEITKQTRTVLEAWMHRARLRSEDFCFRADCTTQTIFPPGSTLE